jgi:membrane protein YdbS with pleckstrin-like domain
MSFPARLLNEGEEVVLDVGPHWWYLAGPVAALVITIAGAIAALAAGPSWARWAALAGLLLAVAWMLGRYTRWASTSLVVTTSRLIRRTGVLGRNGREIPLGALTDISYHQSLFERVIGAGDVLIESAGRRGQEVFPDLPRPAQIQHQISCQVDRVRGLAWAPGPGPGGTSGGGAPAADFSIPAQIDQLDGLRRRGVITDAEFEAKKTELLDRL